MLERLPSEVLAERVCVPYLRPADLARALGSCARLAHSLAAAGPLKSLRRGSRPVARGFQEGRLLAPRPGAVTSAFGWDGTVVGTQPRWRKRYSAKKRRTKI